MVKRIKMGLIAGAVLLSGVLLVAFSQTILSQLKGSMTSAAPNVALPTPVCSLSLRKNNNSATLINGLNTLVDFTIKNTGYQRVWIGKFAFNIQRAGNFTVTSYELVDQASGATFSLTPGYSVGLTEFHLQPIILEGGRSLTLALKATVNGAVTSNSLSADLYPLNEFICSPNLNGLPVNGTPLVY